MYAQRSSLSVRSAIKEVNKELCLKRTFFFLAIEGRGLVSSSMTGMCKGPVAQMS